MQARSCERVTAGRKVAVTKRKGDGHKDSQVRWLDLEPWLQQLEEQYGVYVSVEVLLQGLPNGLQPAVRVTGYTVGVGKERVEKFSDWRVFSLQNVGEVESRALHIVSQALLVLDNENWRAEQRQTSLWGS